VIILEKRISRLAMPLKYKILDDEKLVYVIGAETITFDELLDHLDDLSKDPQYKAPMKKLVDYRNIEKIGVSMAESRTFFKKKASLDKVFSGEKCAIVAIQDFDFGMSRAHTAYIEGADIETVVFRDIQSALSWLNVKLNEDDLTIE
jgi:hypothetical protein